MPVEYVKRFRREEIRANPDKLYVFGDNLARYGYGGQAKECRGEFNCVGIPTKRRPSMDNGAFFKDSDFDEWLRTAIEDLDVIVAALEMGRTVVLPEDGIGTGLAQLEKRAPKIWEYLSEFMLMRFR